MTNFLPQTPDLPTPAATDNKLHPPTSQEADTLSAQQIAQTMNPQRLATLLYQADTFLKVHDDSHDDF